MKIKKFNEFNESINGDTIFYGYFGYVIVKDFLKAILHNVATHRKHKNPIEEILNTLKNWKKDLKVQITKKNILIFRSEILSHNSVINIDLGNKKLLFNTSVSGGRNLFTSVPPYKGLTDTINIDISNEDIKKICESINKSKIKINSGNILNIGYDSQLNEFILN